MRSDQASLDRATRRFARHRAKGRKRAIRDLRNHLDSTSDPPSGDERSNAL